MERPPVDEQQCIDRMQAQVDRLDKKFTDFTEQANSRLRALQGSLVVQEFFSHCLLRWLQPMQPLLVVCPPCLKAKKNAIEKKIANKQGALGEHTLPFRGVIHRKNRAKSESLSV